MKTRALAAETPSAEIESLLDRRAKAAQAASLRAVAEESLAQLARFELGGEPFALRLERLVGVLPLRDVTPVPLAPREVVGLMHRRGEPLTVYSLATLLGVRGWRRDPSVLLVLERGSGARFVVDCEEIPHAVQVPRAALEAAGRPEGATTTLVVEGQPLRLVDVDALVAARSR